MDAIVRNHPFVDGNKRVGVAVAVLFLRINGYELTANNQELESFTLHTTVQKPDIAEMANWFRQYSGRIGPEKN